MSENCIKLHKSSYEKFCSAVGSSRRQSFCRKKTQIKHIFELKYSLHIRVNAHWEGSRKCFHFRDAVCFGAKYIIDNVGEITWTHIGNKKIRSKISFFHWKQKAGTTSAAETENHDSWLNSTCTLLQESNYICIWLCTAFDRKVI